MAYSNWGAEVWCDGEPLIEQCDVTINQVLGDEPRYAHYLEHYINHREDKGGMDDMFHAVVGAPDSGVMVLLYKSYVAVIVDTETWKSIPDPIKDDWDSIRDDREVQHGDVTIEITHSNEPEAVGVWFQDKMGRRWAGTSGYMMGEGHQDWC